MDRRFNIIGENKLASLDTIALIKITFKDYDTGITTDVHYTNAPFHVSYNGITWYAAGQLMTIGSHESSYELITDGVDIKISGISKDAQPVIDKYGFRNAPVDILLAKLPTGTNTVPNASAIYYHRGFAGTPLTEIDEDSGTITVAFETTSVFKNLDDNSRLMTTSLAHHQVYHKDDKFFEYTADSGIGEETWRDE